MTYINIAFLILFAVVMIRGFFRGFVKEAVSAAGIFFAYFGGIYAMSNISGSYYIKIFHNEDIGKVVIFAIAFILVVIVFAVISTVITKILHLLQLGFFNRAGGFFLRGLKPRYF